MHILLRTSLEPAGTPGSDEILLLASGPSDELLLASGGNLRLAEQE